MLCINKDINEMKKYYRTNDMIRLIEYFPELSPIKNLTIVKDCDDFSNNQEYLQTLDTARVDSLIGRGVINGIECSNDINKYLDVIKKIKEKDKLGVLVLFNVDGSITERYEREAGISVGINLGEEVIIEAVGKGFDGREVSKAICTHERYIIPWYSMRKCSIENFKYYRIFKISDEEYQKTRIERTNFLMSLGLDPNVIQKYIPNEYNDIPDIIWLSVIKNIIKVLEKKEDELANAHLTNFAISGHTENNSFAPWQLFDTGRYLVKK